MPVKLITAFVTMLINVTVGVVILFFMLIAMNGYSESDANYGFGTYILLAVIVSLAMSALAVVSVHILVKRDFRAWTAALIAVPVFSVIGAGLKIVCSIIGVSVAEYLRVNY